MRGRMESELGSDAHNTLATQPPPTRQGTKPDTNRFRTRSKEDNRRLHARVNSSSMTTVEATKREVNTISTISE